MSIQHHPIPILEFDSDPQAVIQPDHEKLSLSLPEKCIFAFLGDHVDAYAQSVHAQPVSWFISATKRYPIYIISYQDTDIALCQAPVGAAPAAQLMDWLIGYGVRQIISAGSCGALEPLPENAFLVPCKALRTREPPIIMRRPPASSR